MALRTSADADMQPKATRLRLRPSPERAGSGLRGKCQGTRRNHPSSPSPQDNKASHDAAQKEGTDHAKCASWRESIHLSCFITVMPMRGNDGRRERLHCDQKNFWGVRSLVAAADRRDQILYRRTFRSRRAIEPTKRRGRRACVVCCVKYPPHLPPGNIIYCQKRTGSLVSPSFGIIFLSFGLTWRQCGAGDGRVVRFEISLFRCNPHVGTWAEQRTMYFDFSKSISI